MNSVNGFTAELRNIKNFIHNVLYGNMNVLPTSGQHVCLETLKENRFIVYAIWIFVTLTAVKHSFFVQLVRSDQKLCELGLLPVRICRGRRAIWSSFPLVFLPFLLRFNASTRRLVVLSGPLYWKCRKREN